jgi:5-methylcytosine-specific restriction endonuclease McrA
VVLTQALRLACYRRDGFKCRHCGNRNGLHPHHVEWKGKGGKDELGNLLTLCWKCHGAVHDGKLKVEKENDAIKFTESNKPTA